MGSVRDEDRLDSFFKILSSELNSRYVSGLRKEAVDRLQARMRKRARYVRPHLDAEALEKFKAINERVGSMVVALPAEVVNNAREFIFHTLERYTATLDDDAVQMSLHVPFLLDNWRYGPGASNGVKGTHTAEKIRQDMTCTARCVPLVRKLRAYNTYFSLFDEGRNSGITLIDGSRMTTVPKNEDTVRTIAIEPSGNMAMQLAAGRYLENALRGIGLDISTQQPKNKALALAGSIDGSFATIDLSSASDMISLDLVRLLFPPCWYDLFVALRSPTTDLPNGERVVLNMISTMGNGFTFPMMTLLFTSLVYANRCSKPGPRLFIDWAQTCIFGDDIIVPADEYDGLCVILAQAGFIVNADKSYSVGPFRESCGGDYFLGYDITPFYVKSLATVPDIYVAFNQVLEWSGRHEIAVPATLRYLEELCGKVFLVPEWCNPNQGVLTAQCPARYNYLSIVPVKVRRASDVFDMPLAVGGFIEQSGPHFYFTPRTGKSKLCVRRSRLPKGFLDGRYAARYSDTTSGWISLMVSFLAKK